MPWFSESLRYNNIDAFSAKEYMALYLVVQGFLIFKG